MIDKLITFAKEQQSFGKIITRLDIQFNITTNSYSCRAWYSDGTCYDFTDSTSVNVKEVY